MPFVKHVIIAAAGMGNRLEKEYFKVFSRSK